MVIHHPLSKCSDGWHAVAQATVLFSAWPGSKTTFTKGSLTRWVKQSTDTFETFSAGSLDESGLKTCRLTRQPWIRLARRRCLCCRGDICFVCCLRVELLLIFITIRPVIRARQISGPPAVLIRKQSRILMLGSDGQRELLQTGAPRGGVQNRPGEVETRCRATTERERERKSCVSEMALGTPHRCWKEKAAIFLKDNLIRLYCEPPPPPRVR